MSGLISGALSGAGNLQTIIPVNGRGRLSLQTYWTGTLAATPQLWVSNNYRDPGNGNAAQLTAAEAAAAWSLVTDTAITLFLATAPTGSPPGGKPSGAAGDGTLVIPVTFAAVRYRVTWVSGSGNFNLDANAGE